jgi:hypothetical protein
MMTVVKPQVPAEQTSPTAHKWSPGLGSFAQPPQLAGSRAVSTHSSLQMVRPAWQDRAQRPSPLQTRPSAQAVPQLPSALQ